MRDFLGGPLSEKFIVPSPLVFVFCDDGIGTWIDNDTDIDIDVLRPRAAPKAIDTPKGGQKRDEKQRELRFCGLVTLTIYRSAPDRHQL